MGPSSTNPWLRRFAHPTTPGVPASAGTGDASSGNVLQDIEMLAAKCWDDWTPAKSAADEFRARLATYILRHYHRPPPRDEDGDGPLREADPGNGG